MKTNFIVQAAKAISTSISENRCINLIPYIADDMSVAGMVKAPGLTEYANPGEVSSGIYKASNGRCFTAAGNKLYEITTGGVLTNRGALPIAAVTRFSDNGTVMMIVNGVTGYTYTFSTDTLAAITDVDFPDTCETVTMVDGYFIVCDPDTEIWRISTDGSTWGALDYETSDALPDRNIAVSSLNREPWIFGENSITTYYNSGNADFTFSRGQVIETGCSAPYSIAKLNNHIFWIGRGDTGGNVVYSANGYLPVRRSSAFVELAIQNYSTVSDAIACTIDINGFPLYIVSFPSADETWCYNMKTNLWNQLSTFDNGVNKRWEAQEYTFFDGKHLFCDYLEGKIYEASFDVYADGTNVKKCLMSWRMPESEQRNVRYSKLTILGEFGVGLTSGQGSDPQLMMKFSDDDGKTWSNERKASLGKKGVYNKAVTFDRLGMSRNWKRRIFEISCTDAIAIRLTGAYVQ